MAIHRIPANSYAGKIRKAHIFLDKILENISKIPPSHRTEAAIQAHVLNVKAERLSHKLRAAEVLAGHLPESEKKPTKKSKKGHRR